MATFKTFQQLALSLPGVNEEPHFHLTSFRINKKIFATYDPKVNRACLMLSSHEQGVFCAFNNSIIYPVPNKWGLKGSTYFEIKKLKKEMLKDALECAHHLKCAKASKN